MKNLQQTDCPPGSTALSVVVPVYNSETSLAELAARLRPVLEKTASSYELILVNDGSRDGSWRVIEELAARHDWIRGINLMRNLRPAQCPAVRHPRRAPRRHRDDGRRPAEPPGGDPEAARKARRRLRRGLRHAGDPSSTASSETSPRGSPSLPCRAPWARKRPGMPARFVCSGPP